MEKNKIEKSEKKELLSGIKNLTAGQQAALKREAGKCLHNASTSALQAFYIALPKLDESEIKKQQQIFVVMCLMCLWRQEDRDRTKAKPFPECLKVLRKNNKSMDTRVRGLLDTPWDYDDDYFILKLYRLTKQIRNSSKELYPDFEQLLDDLIKWNNRNRSVQRKWMEQYLLTN